jgi:hypothetical protein
VNKPYIDQSETDCPNRTAFIEKLLMRRLMGEEIPVILSEPALVGDGSRLCACGCGGPIPPDSQRSRRFIDYACSKRYKRAQKEIA